MKTSWDSYLETLTTFQQLELVLIPIILVLSQIFVIFITLAFIGEETWNLIGIPMIAGYLFSTIFIYLLNQKQYIQEFKQLEQLFRFLVVGGGIILIPVLIAQISNLMTFYSIFLILSFVFASISGVMTISCLMFWLRNQFNQNLLK